MNLLPGPGVEMSIVEKIDQRMESGGCNLEEVKVKGGGCK